MMVNLCSRKDLKSLLAIFIIWSLAVLCYLYMVKGFTVTVYLPIHKYFEKDKNEQGSMQNNITIKMSSTRMTIEKNKNILIYSKLFGRPWPFEEKQRKTYLKETGCPVTNCELTYNKKEIASSDVLLFHARDMPSTSHLRSIKRPYHQRWVYFISENPMNTPDVSPLNGLFNWTMTYRADSDISIPYGSYTKYEKKLEIPAYKNYAHGKNKLVAWVVSHCGLLREKYALKLQKYIKVEVGGGCKRKFKNKLNCPRSELACASTLKRDFKFYLSFENGFCEDYISEKYWKNAMLNDVIPVVMGAGPYKSKNHAIQGSFINVEDFPTVKALADYLLYLDKNDTAYNEYFEWKQYYYVNVRSWPHLPLASCQMCQMLHNKSYGHKVYDKLTNFRGVKTNCAGREKNVQKIMSRSVQ